MNSEKNIFVPTGDNIGQKYIIYGKIMILFSHYIMYNKIKKGGAYYENYEK